MDELCWALWTYRCNACETDWNHERKATMPAPHVCPDPACKNSAITAPVVVATIRFVRSPIVEAIHGRRWTFDAGTCRPTFSIATATPFNQGRYVASLRDFLLDYIVFRIFHTELPREMDDE